MSPIDEAGDFQVELAPARQQALEQRPEIRQTQLKIEQAKQDVRVKRAEYIPEVSREFNSVALLNSSSFLPAQSTSRGV